MISAFLLAAAAASPVASLQVDVANVRNARGLLHACLTRNPRYFPDCSADPSAVKQSIPAALRQFRLPPLAPGRWALSVVHDENANQRFDTMLGIPREGFGFSRNPVVRVRAPRFNEVVIELTPGLARQSVRMQYLL